MPRELKGDAALARMLYQQTVRQELLRCRYGHVLSRFSIRAFPTLDYKKIRFEDRS